MKSENKKLKVVLDTNIYISAFAFPGGAPEEGLKLAFNREIEVFISPTVIKEFKRVLKDKFSYSKKEIERFVKNIKSFAVMVEPQKKVNIIKARPADNRILECALEAKADFLISGDKKHILPLKKINGTKITIASKFLEVYYNRAKP